jgi:preprotein translocase subunit SecF
VFDFAGKRWWYLSFSLVLFVIAAVALAIPPHLKPGIEFTSGSSFTIQFQQKSVSQQALRTAMSELGHSEARIQGAGSETFLIHTKELPGAPSVDSTTVVGPQPNTVGEFDKITTGLCERFRADSSTDCTDVAQRATVLTVQDFSTVSSTVSSEIARNATYAVIAASIAILIYISIAFRGLAKPWRYGAAAIIAVLHDAFIVLGLFSILGKVLGTEVDTAFITALLTVIGFSVHDTIVVFDRIRETVTHDPYIPFNEAVNASLTETLARSLNTSFVVVLTVLSLLLIGGSTIRNFLIVLLVGIISGTYSSVGIASQLLVAWENNDIGKFYRRITHRSREGAEPELA